MKIDRTKCDRCGFEKPNPTAFISSATLKMRRVGQELSAVDVQADWCEACFDGIQAAVAAVMAKR